MAKVQQKGNSPKLNFRYHDFYEVRIAPVQRLWASVAQIGCLRVLSDLP